MHLTRPACRLGALLALGCSSPAAKAPPSEQLEPPPEGQGVQFSLRTTIQPGEDVERCLLVQVDRELRVNRDEVRYTRGSHHFLLYLTPYTSMPTHTLGGQPIDPTQVFDCTAEGPTGMFEITSLVGGAQNAAGDPAVSFPPGVAMTVPAGSILMLNAHYLNASDTVLEPEVRINLWTIPPDEVVAEGGLLFWYHPFIRVGARSEGEARAACRVPSQVTLVNTQSHMHSRGRNYEAWLRHAGDAQRIYTSTTWSDVPVKHHEGGLTLPAGSLLEYHCQYRNDEAREVWEGPRTTDEMCMLIGSYYPRVPGLDFCASDPARPVETQQLGLHFIGSGTATCAQSFQCAVAAFESPNTKEDLTRCIEEASPSVAAEFSAALACAFMLEEGDDPMVVCREPFAACLAR